MAEDSGPEQTPRHVVRYRPEDGTWAWVSGDLGPSGPWPPFPVLFDPVEDTETVLEWTVAPLTGTAPGG